MMMLVVTHASQGRGEGDLFFSSAWWSRAPENSHRSLEPGICRPNYLHPQALDRPQITLCL